MSKTKRKPSFYRDVMDVLTGRFTSDVSVNDYMTFEERVQSPPQTRTQFEAFVKAYDDDEKTHRVRKILVDIRRSCIRNPIKIWGDISLAVKSFIQRGQRGYADKDLWSFDHYLSRMLAQALPDFYRHSSEVVYPPTYHETYDGLHPIKALITEDAYDVRKAAADAEWVSIINEMALGFSIWEEDNWWLPNDDGRYPKYKSGYPPELAKSFKLLLKYWSGLWW